MLQTQRTFCDYLDGVKAELTRASALGVFEELGKNIQSAEALKREIAEAELVVPVIGAFSAGKSTLINSFLGSELLPVNITPETALATELRYSDRERVEAMSKPTSKASHHRLGHRRGNRRNGVPLSKIARASWAI